MKNFQSKFDLGLLLNFPKQKRSTSYRRSNLRSARSRFFYTFRLNTQVLVKSVYVLSHELFSFFENIGSKMAAKWFAVYFTHVGRYLLKNY